jgi:hypothetical protein
VSGQPLDRRSCTAVATYRQYPGAVPSTASEHGLKEYGVELEQAMKETQWRDEVVIAAAAAVASSYMHILRCSNTESTQVFGAALSLAVEVATSSLGGVGQASWVPCCSGR